MSGGERSETVAIIGAGIIGCAAAWALSREGRRVLLLDRAEPVTAGASFGNVGHIATEQVEPLPSRQLLFGFWRELFAFDGALDLPLRRLLALSPWIARFAVAAFRQKSNTPPLAALVRSAADSLESLLGEIGRGDLIRRKGHYAVWLGAQAASQAAQGAEGAARLGVRTLEAPPELVRKSAVAAHEPTAAGLWFPDTAHVLDPADVGRAMASAAVQRGATLQRVSVRQVNASGEGLEIQTDTGRLSVGAAVICAGAWSPPLLAPFGIRAPLEAERGYHVELPGHEPLIDAPILYANQKVVVTPMAARLRGSSYLEFGGLDAPPDPRKPARLRAKLRKLGYRCEPHGPSWMGPRPTLPDYLPAIGRVPGQFNLFYAFGHQHLGLTLAAPTAGLVADLVAGRTPRLDTSAFDLQRFGRSG
jgi:D-amino-acid dehydrogenase